MPNFSGNGDGTTDWGYTTEIEKQIQAVDDPWSVSAPAHSDILNEDFASEAEKQAAEERAAIMRDAAEQNALYDMPEEQFNALVEQSQKSQAERIHEARAEAAAETFVRLHPEYSAIPANGRLIEAVIAASGMERTLENIEAVYIDLAERGLIQLNADVLKQQQAETRQQQAEQIKRRSSGISSRSGLPIYTAPESPEQQRERLYSMSDSEFAKLEPSTW